MLKNALAVLGVVGAVTLAAPAFAQSTATISIDAHSAAAGVGYSWGDGTLRYHGHTYHFTVNGLTVADVGYAHVYGHGHVTGLAHLHDFDGTYAAADGQATLDKGIGGELLRNSNGVTIKLDDVSRGARLAAAAGGIQLALK